MSRIGDFLHETKTFYLATCDSEQPKIRPLGLFLDEDGKIIFGVGNFKNVYKQMLKNPNVEIVACKPNGHWLRYTGKAVFETDEKYSEEALNKMPGLRKIYNAETGNKLAMFHLENATALDIPMMGEGENLL